MLVVALPGPSKLILKALTAPNRFDDPVYLIVAPGPVMVEFPAVSVLETT
jgi:hypothetical protein